MPRILLILVVVGLMAYALTDVWGADEEERGGLPRWLWVILIVFLPLLGAISWIVVRVAARRSGAGPASGPGGGGSRPTPPPRPPRPSPRRPSSGPVAPDDDPEFLWLLEQEKRKREREARGRQDAKDDDTENG